MPTPTTFGRRLKEIRETRGLTQADLEAKAKVPAAMISHFETGVRPTASADTLVKVANALEVSIDYLVGRSDDPIPRGGKVETVLRSLEQSSSETLNTVLAIAKTLSQQDENKRKKV